MSAIFAARTLPAARIRLIRTPPSGPPARIDRATQRPRTRRPIERSRSRSATTHRPRRRAHCRDRARVHVWGRGGRSRGVGASGRCDTEPRHRRQQEARARGVRPRRASHPDAARRADEQCRYPRWVSVRRRTGVARGREQSHDLSAESGRRHPQQVEQSPAVSLPKYQSQAPELDNCLGAIVEVVEICEADPINAGRDAPAP